MSVEALARPDLWSCLQYPAQGINRDQQIRLNCNENPWPPQGAQDALIHRYPEKQPAELLRRMAALFEVEPNQILVTRGADDGIDALLRSFCLPGVDTVVQCSPAFVMYAFFARLQAVKVVDVPLLANAEFGVPFDTLAAQQDAKIFFFCSPNNPTGSLVDSQKILEFADRVSSRALVVLDEAYIEFAETPSLCRAATQTQNLLVLRTLSKAWSLAGARLGAVVGGAETIRYLQATTSPYPLSRTAVTTACDALTPAAIQEAGARIADICSRREDFARAIMEFPFVRKVYPSAANFLLLHVDDASQLVEFCGQSGVLIRNQSQQPGLQEHVRISIGSAAEMQQLRQVLSQYQKAIPCP